MEVPIIESRSTGIFNRSLEILLFGLLVDPKVTIFRLFASLSELLEVLALQ